MWVTPLVAAALSETKAGLPAKNGSMRTALPAKSRRKAEWPYQVICMSRGRRGREAVVRPEHRDPPTARSTALARPCLHGRHHQMPAPILDLVAAAAHLPARGALIGLDLGTKTIGVATSDPDRRLATGVETIARTVFAADAARLLALAAERRAVGFVLGLPINMDGSEGPRAQSTRSFARNFARVTELP